MTFTDDGTMAAGVGVLRWYNDSGAARTLSKVRATLAVAPGSQSVIFDLNVNGASVWNPGDRATIPVGQNTVLATAFSTTTVPAGGYLTLDIDQAGASPAGSGLTFTVWMT